jgi:hypothetical protein
MVGLVSVLMSPSLSRRVHVHPPRGGARAEARIPTGAGHGPVHEVNELAPDTDAQVERWRSVAEERAIALARAEGENRVLREALDRERTLVEEHKNRADRLEARLAQPWWRRWWGQ